MPTAIINDCLYKSSKEHNIKTHINNKERKNAIMKKCVGGMFITMKVIAAKRKKRASMRMNGNLSLLLDERIELLYTVFLFFAKIDRDSI